MLAELATDVLYTAFMQDEISFAGYWHSPLDDESEYLSRAYSLPHWNGLRIDDGRNNDTVRFKANLQRVRQLVLLGSPDDGTVEPWQTALFGFYATNSTSRTVSLEQTAVYLKDTLGLQEFVKNGRLKRIAVDGVPHADWLSNRTNFLQNVLPYLN